MITQLMFDTSGSPFVLVWVLLGRGHEVREVRDEYRQYRAAKRHQTKAVRAALMIFDSLGQDLLELQFDNRESGADPLR